MINELPEDVKPQVHRVEKNGRESWLIGTQHDISDEVFIAKAFPFIDGRRRAFFESCGDGVEPTTEYLFLPDDETLFDIMDRGELEEVFEAVRTLYEGFPRELVTEKINHIKRMRPLHAEGQLAAWYISDEIAAHKHHLQRAREAGARRRRGEHISHEEITELLEGPPTEFGRHFDLQLYNRASAGQVPASRLDDPYEFTDLLEEIPRRAQFSILLQTARDITGGTVDLETATRHYLSGDADAANQGISSDSSPRGIYWEKMIFERTRQWFERTLPEFEEGNVVAAVGWLHVVGEPGYLSLLKEEGFSAEHVMGKSS